MSKACLKMLSLAVSHTGKQPPCLFNHGGLPLFICHECRAPTQGEDCVTANTLSKTIATPKSTACRMELLLL